jgi:hypothetical protein
MKRRRRRHEGTAYREAGHAVAAVVLGLKIGRWTLRIARNKDVHRRDYTRLVAQLRLPPDCGSNARTRALLENWAIACLVGDAIERKLKRKRQSGGPRDRPTCSGSAGVPCDLMGAARRQN